MPYPREVVEQVKAAILKETEGMRELNKVIPVTGERCSLPVHDREIPIVYYRAKRPDMPLILGFHGGGFLFGGCAMNDAMWSAVSEELSCNVASVDYRKSPDYMYMDAIEDAIEAAQYLKAHAQEFGHNGQLSVMGCSAGANVATAACLYAKTQGMEQFDRQVLLYPFLDLDTDPAAKGPGSLDGPIMQVFNEMHCLPEETKNPLVSPVFAQEHELEDMPAAVIVLADNDNLRPEGQTYARMLRKAGVPVALTVCERMPHGFFESGFGKISEAEIEFLGEEVRALIRNGAVHEKSVVALQYIKEHWDITG